MTKKPLTLLGRRLIKSQLLYQLSYAPFQGVRVYMRKSKCTPNSIEEALIPQFVGESSLTLTEAFVPRPNKGVCLWMHPKTGIWYARRYLNGKRQIRSTGTGDRDLAEKRLAWKTETPGTPGLAYRTMEEGLTPAFINRMYVRCRTNAAYRKIEFHLARSDVDEMLLECEGRCSVTGMVLSIKQWRDPWLPSIDRIDCAKGYSKANSRIVCLAANIAMSNWGEHVLYTMLDSLQSMPKDKRPFMALEPRAHPSRNRRPPNSNRAAA